MNKNEYLLQMVTLLEPYRNQGPEIKQALLAGQLTDEQIQKIIILIEQTIKNEKDVKKKKKLQQGLSVLQKIQEREKQEQKYDLQELSQIEGTMFA